MKADITAIILTFNESQHIKRCIESVRDFCCDIVVVDSYSTDNTQAIAEQLGARFYPHVFVNHARQFNWALDNLDISTQWILRIDADEYVEPELEIEIRSALIKVSDDVNGFTVRRKYFFLRQWVRYGAMYPVNTLRLWRKGKGYVEQRWMDEHVVVDDNTKILNLHGNIVDDNLNSVSWWIAKHNNYATLEMIELLNLKYHFSEISSSILKSSGGQARAKRWIKQTIYARLPYFFRPFIYFLYRYFIKLGFMDGLKGLAFHFMQGYWYRSLVDLKMLEAEEWIGDVTEPERIREIISTKTGLDL